MPVQDSNRQEGKVFKLMGDYGFISSEACPGQDIYFQKGWFEGSLPIIEGEEVTFQLREFRGKPQAHHIQRLTENPEVPPTPPQNPTRNSLLPRSDYLFDWAYLGYLPDVLDDLRRLALDEDWQFRNSAPDPDKPHPILHSYLLHTYGRLVHENKVLVNDSLDRAAFNTGLVDRRYEPIYALFTPNPDPRAPWSLWKFVIAGEGEGKELVRHFNPLPVAAHYFDDPADLLYDVRMGSPELSFEHIIIDNIDRFPHAFLEPNCPDGFNLEDVSAMDSIEQKAYYDRLRAAIRNDTKKYRSIIFHMREALDLTIKRVSWNFKTAIPQYYPRAKSLMLLLPICLVSDDEVDVALAVERTPVKSYLGHTILPLDWAYKNARLVCRPDSDWLNPKAISQSQVAESLV